MNITNIRKAISQLIQNHSDNSIPPSDTIQVIFTLTKENFKELSQSEQEAVQKFSAMMEKTSITQQPKWIKPFRAFQNELYDAMKEPSRSKKFLLEAVKPDNLLDIHQFLTAQELHKSAVVNKTLQTISDGEKVRRLNLGESATNLGFDKATIVSFLKKHGSAINKLTINDPKYLHDSENLKDLDIATIIPLCPNLTDLSLVSCNLTDQDAAVIIQLLPKSKILSLDLSRNGKISTIPKEIGNLTQLQKLDLTRNNIQALPPEIGNLFQLQKLDLSNNQIQTIPAEIGKLTQLQKLNLFGNNLQALPPEIGNLTQLQRLDLTHTNIEALPPEIGNLAQLQVLNLFGNNLQALPPEIGKLSKLQTLDLGVNKLGIFPPEIGNLLQLQVLNLSSNNIQAIPPEIGNFSQLQTLYLVSNKITSIPSEIWSLLQLQVLNLSHNNISMIPSEIKNLLQLQMLNLLGNPFPDNDATQKELEELLPACMLWI
jgi:Leucine-rich repeat (LRR) protein